MNRRFRLTTACALHSTLWRRARAIFALICLVAPLGCGSDSESGGNGSGADAETDADPDVGPIDTPDVPDTGVKPDVPDVVDDAETIGDDTVDAEETDTGPKVGEFGYPCTDNNQCLSGYCVDSEMGRVCTQFCVTECPAGWDCVLNSGSGADVNYLCVSRFAQICRPCALSAECNPLGNTKNACIDFDGNGSFCGVDCSAGNPCPDGFSCEDVTMPNGAQLQQCLPESGDCMCRPAFVAQSLSTGCTIANEYGKCTGSRMCTPDGLSECSALIPQQEACNGFDDNCDGIIDPHNSAGCTNYWEDNDGDGYGVGLPVCACSPPSPKSVTIGGDCNDLNPDVKPGAVEYCNGIDDNCDGVIDEPGSQGCVDYFADFDGDKFGDDNNIICQCKPTSDVTLVGGDCDDTKAAVNPNATEKCNGFDDNCNGVIDEMNAEGCVPYFFDGDNDGFGVDGVFQCLCAPSAPYTATVVGDCNDAEPEIAPFKPEKCNGIDDNCNGQTDEGDPLELCGPVFSGVSACTGGKCVVESCEPGWFDIVDDFPLSCECKINAVEISGPACGGAHNLGTLSDNGSTVTIQGIAVSDTESDWYRFTGTDGPDKTQGAFFCDSYHVRVRFLFNPENTYLFDVYRGSCASGNQICVSSTDFSWRTNFFENKKGECPCHPNKPNTAVGVQQCTDNTAGYWIRVYRDPSKPKICQSYNIEITNGVY